MTIQNREVIKDKEEEDIIILTKQEITNKVKAEKEDVVIITKHELKKQ